MKIKNFKIDNFRRPFFIAEIGINHNGNLLLAKKLIHKAKSLGADAVKFQSFKKKNLWIEGFYKNKKADFKFDNKTKNLEDIIDRISLSEANQKSLSEYCKKKKIIFSSTPLDLKAVDFLESLRVPFFKIASMDLNHHLLLKKIASTGKPIILSTGFASIKEIEEAINIIKKKNTKSKIALLHCISAYPPRDDQINIQNINYLRKHFNLPIGFSDHTIGISASLSAISNGACIIEKHFTLDKESVGWDHKISATPSELKIIVKEGIRINKMLGSEKRIISTTEQKFKKNMRRSIVTETFIKKGSIIKLENINFKRPGTGIEPPNYLKIINKKIAKKNLAPDILLKKNHFK